MHISTEQVYASRVLEDLNNESTRQSFADWIEENQHHGDYDLGGYASEDDRIAILRQSGGFYFIMECDEGARKVYRDFYCLWYSPDNHNSAVIGPVPMRPKCCVCSREIKGRLVSSPVETKLCCEYDNCVRKFTGNDPRDIWERYRSGKSAAIKASEVRGG